MQQAHVGCDALFSALLVNGVDKCSDDFRKVDEGARKVDVEEDIVVQHHAQSVC